MGDRFWKTGYVARLVLKHPTMNSKVISEGIGSDPSKSWTKGDVVESVPGVRSYSMATWINNFDEDIHTSQNNILNKIAKSSIFLAEFTASGGSASLIFDLSGSDNIGVIFDTEKMKILVNANVSLGFEVFPK